MGSRLDAGRHHTCALVADARVRCWGYGFDGQLGYANPASVGDDEVPGSVGPVDLGTGPTGALSNVVAVAAGDFHTCALLDDGSVRCWGLGGNGRLGYGNLDSIGDDETPGSVRPVDLAGPTDPPRTATAITSGGSHTCALLDDGSVRCWGYGGDGQLGYRNTDDVGYRETPGSVGPVDLGTDPTGTPRTAQAISAGGRHTCAILNDGSVRCWGDGGDGQLGYANTDDVGYRETPGSVGPVDLGTDPTGTRRTAKAISAGQSHTCALLSDATTLCWGYGADGELGYGSPESVGDDETPASVGPVDLGPERSAVAISAGQNHTCAVLDDGSLRCWGYGGNGRLGYRATENIGDYESVASLGPVDLGPQRSAAAVSAGGRHTCARLDDGEVRCWGYGASGRLGYCNESNVGDDETPGAAGPVELGTGGGSRCPSPGGGPAGGDSSGTGGSGAVATAGGTATAPPTGGAQSGGELSLDAAIRSQARRARALGRCLAQARRNAKRTGSRGGLGSARAKRRRTRAQRACLNRYGRTPGRVTGLRARAVSETEIVLSFTAPGSNGARPPAARAYLVKQSPRPIRSARDFARAQSLCQGSCRFSVTRPGTRIDLTITDLQPKTTFYYAVAARDNVSRRVGARSKAVTARTR